MKKQEGKSRRGGANRGQGRIPLWQTRRCGWIVDEVRKLSRKAVERKRDKRMEAQFEEYPDLRELYATLSRYRGRPDAAAETLEDIRYHFLSKELGGAGLPRLILGAPSLSPREIGTIYNQVALAATKEFGRLISPRNVKDCISKWLAFEKSLE